MARAWLEDARQIKGTTSEKGWDNFALTAIAIAEDHPDEAREYISNAIALLDRNPGHSGSIAAARARLVTLWGRRPGPPSLIS